MAAKFALFRLISPKTTLADFRLKAKASPSSSRASPPAPREPQSGPKWSPGPSNPSTLRSEFRALRGKVYLPPYPPSCWTPSGPDVEKPEKTRSNHKNSCFASTLEAVSAPLGALSRTSVSRVATLIQKVTKIDRGSDPNPNRAQNRFGWRP